MRCKLAIEFVVALCLAVSWAMPAGSAQSLPRLYVTPTSNHIVVVSWPAAGSNVVLQETSGIGPLAAWQTSTLLVSSNNGVMSVSASTTNATRFYRLAGDPAPALPGNYLLNGVVAYWKMNDESGTVAADSSGSGINLPLIGLPGWGSNFVTFNGSTQYGDAGSNILSSLDQHDKTICAWVFKTGNSQKGIVDKSFDIPNVGHGGWGFWVQPDGHLLWTVQDIEEFSDDGFAGVTPGTWTFVTVVWHYPALQADFYINGLINSIVGNGAADEESSFLADLQVGNIRNDSSNGLFSFDGSMRDVAIYNRALSEAEVQTNFLATESTTNVAFPSLLYYKMTEHAQTNPPIFLADSSSHGGTTGTVQTATSVQWVTNQASMPQAALHFNGVSTYLDTGNSNLFNFTTNSFTINLWLLPLTANGYIMANGFFHGNGWFMSVGGSYQLSFGSETFGAETAIKTVAPVSGWPSLYNMVTVTRNGTNTPLIYINGSVVATTGSFASPASSGDSLVVGVSKVADNFLDGDISELQIWNTNLSATDVANLYFNQQSGASWP